MPANSFYHNDENQESILTKENFMGVEFSPLVRPRIKESQVSVLKSADVNIGKKQMGGGEAAGKPNVSPGSATDKFVLPLPPSIPGA